MGPTSTHQSHANELKANFGCQLWWFHHNWLKWIMFYRWQHFWFATLSVALLQPWFNSWYITNVFKDSALLSRIGKAFWNPQNLSLGAFARANGRLEQIAIYFFIYNFVAICNLHNNSIMSSKGMQFLIFNMNIRRINKRLP